VQEYLSEQQVQEGVKKIADALLGRPSILPDIIMPIMTGSLLFASDLVRYVYPDLNPIVFPIKMNRIRSYSDPAKFVAIFNKRILLVDTVYDTGVTATTAKRIMQERHARSTLVAVLVWKNLKDAEGKPDYWAYSLDGDDKYLVGYGLDKEGRYRGLKSIRY